MMTKILGSLLLVAWFFSIQSEVAPGIKAVTTIGGFFNKAMCDAFRDDLLEGFAIMGAQAEVTGCVERRDA